jgi:hypothetical protein
MNTAITIATGVAAFAVQAYIVIDYVRLRLQRHNGCETCARLAAEALAGDTTTVDGVRMPDPNDPRWSPVDLIVTLGSGKDKKIVALALGDVRVCMDGDETVFFGNGPGAKGGDYPNRVVRAYRQRLADKAAQNG